MADNIATTEDGTFAADEIASVKYLRSKVVWGADGTANDASAAAPLPVVQTGTLNVGTVSTLSAMPATFAEDAAHVDGATGVFVLGVTRAADTTMVSHDGDYTPFQMTAQGSLKVCVEEDPTAPVVGQTTMSASIPVVIASDQSSVGVIPKPTTSGGVTVYRNIDLDESDVAVKASAGQLYGWDIFNAATSTRYVKLYNLSTANTSVGTSTPHITLAVPGGASISQFMPTGTPFSTAITAAATTDLTEDGSPGAPSANDVIVTFYYA